MVAVAVDTVAAIPDFLVALEVDLEEVQPVAATWLHKKIPSS